MEISKVSRWVLVLFSCLWLTACDLDKDGINGSEDNCPLIANADQLDSDGDGIGDVCDSTPLPPEPTEGDLDGDGVNDDVDNCPNGSNAQQTDTDDDGAGDVCDFAPEDAEIAGRIIGTATQDSIILKVTKFYSADGRLVRSNYEDTPGNEGSPIFYRYGTDGMMSEIDYGINPFSQEALVTTLVYENQKLVNLKGAFVRDDPAFESISYNEAGLLTQLTEASGSLKFVYNENDQKVSSTVTQGEGLYWYSPEGQVVETSHVAPSDSDALGFLKIYRYDESGRIKWAEVHAQSEDILGDLLWKVIYEYDDTSNMLIGRSQSMPNGSIEREESYTYDGTVPNYRDNFGFSFFSIGVGVTEPKLSLAKAGSNFYYPTATESYCRPIICDSPY